jgi:hypothetical protein
VAKLPRQQCQLLKRWVRAFSSEVDTGSREENASKQKIERGRDSIQSECALEESIRDRRK